MKYLDKKFQSPGNSKSYVENWESVFGEKQPKTEQPDEEKTETVESSVDTPTP